jgi:hypothetical protein
LLLSNLVHVQRVAVIDAHFILFSKGETVCRAIFDTVATENTKFSTDVRTRRRIFLLLSRIIARASFNFYRKHGSNVN